MFSLFQSLLDIVFPRSKTAQVLQKMNAADFLGAVTRGHDLHDITAYFAYRDPLVHEAIWQIKYRRNKHVAQLFATLLSDLLLEDLEHKTAFENFTDPVLIPIPLSKKKKRERGYNQIELITKALDVDFLTIDTQSLARITHTKSQTKTLGREERVENIRNCFSVIDPTQVQNKNIILLDDVVTTGSTLREAKQTLLKAGARNVWCVALAH